MKRKAKKNNPMATGAYSTVGKTRKRVQTAHRAWYMTSLGSVIIALLFSVLDASTLFTQFDTAMNAAMTIIWVVTAGICIAENFVPMLAASYFHQCFTLGYRGKKYKVLFAVSVTASILLLSALMYMRWATRTASIDLSVSSLSGDAANFAPIQEDSGVRDSLATVLSLVPWITSCITFMMAYFTDNPLENRRHAVQLKILETKERLTDLNATLKEVEEHDLSTMEELVRTEYYTVVAALEEKAAGWDALARRKLMEKLGTAQAISQLSDKARSTSLDSLPEPTLHLQNSAQMSLPKVEHACAE